jgi:hypothetical protein
MKKITSMLSYGIIAGASMYGGYLLGSNMLKQSRKKVQTRTNDNLKVK